MIIILVSLSHCPFLTLAPFLSFLPTFYLSSSFIAAIFLSCINSFSFIIIQFLYFNLYLSVISSFFPVLSTSLPFVSFTNFFFLYSCPLYLSKFFFFFGGVFLFSLSLPFSSFPSLSLLFVSFRVTVCFPLSLFSFYSLFSSSPFACVCFPLLSSAGVWVCANEEVRWSGNGRNPSLVFPSLYVFLSPSVSVSSCLLSSCPLFFLLSSCSCLFCAAVFSSFRLCLSVCIRVCFLSAFVSISISLSLSLSVSSSFYLVLSVPLSSILVCLFSVPLSISLTIFLCFHYCLFLSIFVYLFCSA